VWGRGRYLGLLHEACAVRVGAVVVPAATDARPAAPLPEAVARPAPAPRPEHPRTGGVLTPRQIAVVARLAQGHTLAQVAEIDGIGIGAVKNALHRARTRLGVADNAAVVEVARRHGLIHTTKEN
jgi:DNA-binding CsgD family transcriptional regulator